MKAFLAALLGLFFSAAIWAHDGPDLEIVTLSNRADLISGGDALVEVRVPKQVSLSAVKVKLNGHDITSSFKTNAAARTLRGLVTGLADGRNDLVAEADSKGKGKDKDDGKEVRLTNLSKVFWATGPLFATVGGAFQTDIGVVDAHSGEVLAFLRTVLFKDPTAKSEERFPPLIREALRDVPLPIPAPRN